MLHKIALASAALALAGCSAMAQDTATSQNALMMAPPAAPYQQVSKLVPLPDFIPGLGTLYVDPATLPAGPFLAYDHDGKLSATVYMVPIAALEKGTAFADLDTGSHDVSSVDIMYNAGHPGVAEPHVHVILYHDDGAKARLAK